MTNHERAEKIVQHIESIYGKRTGWAIDFFTSQLDEAQLEVLEQNEVLVKMRIDKAVSDALKDMEVLYEKDLKMRIDRACRSAEQDGNIDGYKKGCEAGFASAREQAAMIVSEPRIYPLRESVSEHIAERIRAMEADKP